MVFVSSKFSIFPIIFAWTKFNKIENLQRKQMATDVLCQWLSSCHNSDMIVFDRWNAIKKHTIRGG